MAKVFPEGLTMNRDHVSFNPAPKLPQVVGHRLGVTGVKPSSGLSVFSCILFFNPFVPKTEHSSRQGPAASGCEENRDPTAEGSQS